MVKKHPFAIFSQLSCVAFSWVLTAMAKILKNSWIFASWKFFMYYSIEQTTKTYNSVCYCKKNITREKKKTGIEQINCRFVGAHPRSQRPRSFLVSTKSQTSGRSQHRRSQNERNLCSNLINLTGSKLQNEHSAHAQKLAVTRSLDSWRWPKGSWPLGTRMVGAMFVFSNLCAHAAWHLHERVQKNILSKKFIYFTPNR